MNSASATFWVQDTAYTVRSLTQHMHQETTENGSVTSRPTSSELRMLLDVIPGDVLLPTWAYSPDKALSARVVFDALDSGSSSMTLILEDAYCVSYEEHFEPNQAGGNAALYCVVSVVARRISKRGVEYVNFWTPTNQ